MSEKDLTANTEDSLEEELRVIVKRLTRIEDAMATARRAGTFLFGYGTGLVLFAIGVMIVLDGHFLAGGVLSLVAGFLLMLGYFLWWLSKPAWVTPIWRIE